MSWLRAIICSGSSWRYSIARMACSVPVVPRQRRPGHRPCLPRMKRRAVSMLIVSIIAFGPHLLVLNARQPGVYVWLMVIVEMVKELTGEEAFTVHPH